MTGRGRLLSDRGASAAGMRSVAGSGADAGGALACIAALVLVIVPLTTALSTYSLMSTRHSHRSAALRT
jgi:hypothetical protein